MALADKYKTGVITGVVSSSFIAQEMGISRSGAIYVLKELGFTVTERKREKPGGNKVSIWTPPGNLPAAFLRSRQLRRMGLSMEKNQGQVDGTALPVRR